ncbi:hypothetical protein D3C71_1911550 [compost metagenome]
MTVFTRQQVIGDMIQFPAGLFVGDSLTPVKQASEDQIFGLRQPRDMTAIRLRHRAVRYLREDEAASLQVLGALGATEANPVNLGEINQRALLKRAQPD